MRRVTLMAAMVLGACSSQKDAVAVMPGGDEAPLTADAGGWSLRLARPDGGTLPAHPWRGGLFFEGAQGERYTVRVDNPTPRRVEAVITVDGRDVLTGELGDFAKHRGYIVEPYGHVTVEGFRQSMDAVATFRFTTPEDSYTARMGSPQHVGVVGVAIFPESAPAPVAAPAPYPEDRAEAEAAPSGEARAGAKLGTQYGESRLSPVVETPFQRADSERPAAVLAVYYDDRQGLVERGILTAPPAWDPQPFPGGDRRFAPPPP
jgi:hypothetical protein